jgi:hypothetical protein
MVRLGQRRREILIEKAPDMANALAVSTLVGQFLTDRPFSMLLAAIGAVAWLGLWVFALILAEDEQR